MKKRKRKEATSEDEHAELIVDAEQEEEVAQVTEQEKVSRAQGHQGKQRRIETMGKKQVDREVYRKGREQQRQKQRGEQWSR